MTKTYATMEVSPVTYEEIVGKLLQAGYTHCIHANNSILGGGVTLDGIILVQTPITCVVCCKEKKLTQYKGNSLCGDCIHDLKVGGE